MASASDTASNFDPSSAELSQNDSQSSEQSDDAKFGEDRASEAVSPSDANGSFRREKGYMKVNRLANRYSKEYVELLNEDIIAASAPFLNVPSDRLRSSYISGSYWSGNEKAVLFEAIARFGRDDLPSIAEAVGTKSPLECRALLLLLRRGLLEQSLNAEKHQLLAWIDVPAAVEISAPVVERLDVAAEAVSAKIWAREMKREKEQWGTTWCINYEIATKLDALTSDETRGRKRSREADDNESDGGAKRPKSDARETKDPIQADDELQTAASMFHCRTWVALQHNIFMNAGGPRADENWRSIATEDEEPSLMRTALTDFYQLAFVLTQRLVSATLMQATSRARAASRRDGMEVTRDDALAALRALNIPLNSRDVWSNAPRRSGVQVNHDDPGIADPDGPLAYEEVEAALTDHPIPERDHDESDSEIELITSAHAQLEDEDKRLEAYTDELDEMASRADEHRLLEMLGESIAVQHEPPAPMRPEVRRRLEPDLVDWRDWTTDWLVRKMS